MEKRDAKDARWIDAEGSSFRSSTLLNDASEMRRNAEYFRNLQQVEKDANDKDEEEDHEDLYAILGVGRRAASGEIKRAWRRHKIWHPDKSWKLLQSATSDEERRALATTRRKMWDRVQEAYEVLSDPERRACYDRLGRKGLEAMAKHKTALTIISEGRDETIEMLRTLMHAEARADFDEHIGTNGAIVLNCDASETFSRVVEASSSLFVDNEAEEEVDGIVNDEEDTTFWESFREIAPDFNAVTIAQQFDLNGPKSIRNSHVNISGRVDTHRGLGVGEVGVALSGEIDPETDFEVGVDVGSSESSIHVASSRRLTRRMHARCSVALKDTGGVSLGLRTTRKLAERTTARAGVDVEIEVDEEGHFLGVQPSPSFVVTHVFSDRAQRRTGAESTNRDASSRYPIRSAELRVKANSVGVTYTHKLSPRLRCNVGVVLSANMREGPSGQPNVQIEALAVQQIGTLTHVSVGAVNGTKGSSLSVALTHGAMVLKVPIILVPSHAWSPLATVASLAVVGAAGMWMRFRGKRWPRSVLLEPRWGARCIFDGRLHGWADTRPDTVREQMGKIATTKTGRLGRETIEATASREAAATADDAGSDGECEARGEA